jgi:pimeloyl-ACP methyl ester carboxylesterase
MLAAASPLALSLLLAASTAPSATDPAASAGPAKTPEPPTLPAAAEVSASPPPKLVLGDCPAGEFPPDARCGTYEVFENRDAQSGRKITLQVVVLPATGTPRRDDPVTYFAGGPGGSSVHGGIYLAEELAALRHQRDFLLVDFRGTGGSTGLYCTELQGAPSLQGFLDDFLPVAGVRACRDRLAAERDLSWYTTDAAIDDIEEVRRALGYGPLNLVGGSYGTRAALTYLRRHPESVRTATLHGVVPPANGYPLFVARYAEDALAGLLAECEADRACQSAFPELRADLRMLIDRVTAEPVQVGLYDLDSGAVFYVFLGRSGVAQTLRYLLYTPGDAALVPLLVHEAARGNFEPLAQVARKQGSWLSHDADGFYLSVTCAEDLATVREEDIAPAVADTLIGDFRIRRQLAACEGWPVRPLPAGASDPVSSAVPTLLVSGERDPVTPAADAEAVARTLSRSRHLIVPDGAHGIDGMRGADCLAELQADFIRTGDVAGLDASCVERMRRPPFALDTGEREIRPVPANLERLVGAYEDTRRSLPVRIDQVGPRLRLTLGDTKVLLIPTGSTSFRLEGFPPDVVLRFELRDGAVTGGRLAFPGDHDVILERR